MRPSVVSLANLRPHPQGQPALNRGSRASWVGTWGDFTDARSRLSRRARTIEWELRREHRTSTALWRRRLKQAARFAALAEKILETFGQDPTATPQRAAKLQGSSERLLRLVPLRQRQAADIATQIQRAQARRRS